MKDFIKRDFFLFKEYYEKKELFENGEMWIIGNKTKLKDANETSFAKQSRLSECMDFFNYNQTCIDEITGESKKKLAEYNEKLNASFTTVDEVLTALTARLNEKEIFLEENRPKLEAGRQKVERFNEILWTVLNSLFVVGGMVGALTSKYVLDFLGRKKGIIFNSGIGLLAAILVFVSFYAKSPVCLILSRLFYGIQGGMACSLV